MTAEEQRQFDIHLKASSLIYSSYTWATRHQIGRQLRMDLDVKLSGGDISANLERDRLIYCKYAYATAIRATELAYRNDVTKTANDPWPVESDYAGTQLPTVYTQGVAMNGIAGMSDYQAGIVADFDALIRQIQDESTARETGDAANAASISAETTRAEAAESANATAITNEASARAAADTTNTTAISSEVSRATTAETSNANAISAETSRATAAENAKLAKASNLSDVASAATARTNLGLGSAATHPASDFDASGAATSAVAAEATLRASGDSTNSTAISTEATRAQAAEATLTTAVNGKEPAITGGTAAQYWRGDKTWRDFMTDVRATLLTGLSTATNAAITATDTILVALGKLQAQLSGLGSAATQPSSAFATAAQGTKADSALQTQTQADWTQGTNTAASYIQNKPTLGTAAAQASTAFATAAQGAKADTAVQSGNAPLSVAGTVMSIAAASGSVAGSMSAADKTKLDGITSGATALALSSTLPANLAVAAAIGVGTTAARSDHAHKGPEIASGSANTGTTIGIGGSLDIVVTLSMTMSSTAYFAIPSLGGSTAITLLGNLSVVVKSQTTTQVTVTIKNTGLTIAATGITVVVFAHNP